MVSMADLRTTRNVMDGVHALQTGYASLIDDALQRPRNEEREWATTKVYDSYDQALLAAVHAPPVQDIREAAKIEGVMQFFVHAHLPPHLAEVSAGYCELAEAVRTSLPVSTRTYTALRLLLEAKDCAVRSVLTKEATP